MVQREFDSCAYGERPSAPEHEWGGGSRLKGTASALLRGWTRVVEWLRQLQRALTNQSELAHNAVNPASLLPHSIAGGCMERKYGVYEPYSHGLD